LTSNLSSQGNSNRLSAWMFRYRFFLLAIACLWLVFFLLPGTRTMPLLEPDEGRNAEVAREMLTGGDWVTPHYDGYAYLDKPAPFFWLVASSFKLFGFSEWAARFPSGIAALAALLLVCVLAWRMFGPDEAMICALIAATSPLFLIFTRQVIFDMTLTFLVTAALLCFWWDEQRPERRRSTDMLMFAVLGVATITKGPVGFLLPLLGILAYSLLRGGMARFKRLHWGWGLLAFLAAGLPWFIAVTVRNADFPRYAFWQESLVRFTTGSARRAGSVFYYLPVYLGGFFPWSFPLAYACIPRLRKWKALREENNAALAFLIAFVLVVFVFFTISRSKLPGYFLPAIGPLGILMARLWTTSKDREAQRMPDWLTAAFATLVGVGLLLIIVPRFESLHMVRVRVEKKMPQDVLALVKPALVYSGILLVALGILGRNVASRARRKVPTNALLALLLLAAPLLLLQWLKPIKRYVANESSKSLAESILTSPDRNLPVYGYYYFRTSLPFYLRRPVGLVTSGAEEMTSNFVVSRWPDVHPEMARAGFEVGLPAPGLNGFPGPLVRERDWREKTAASPTLVFLQNGLVPNLYKSRGSANPLWNGWGYSVWEVPAKTDEADAPQ
jgi:4-amino-4-deoxy-L-arabinose transferase-like glycosyltransferase